MNNKDKLGGNNFNFTLNNYINNNFTSATPSNSVKYRISKGKSYQQLHSSNKTTQGNLPYSNNNICTFVDKIGMNNSFISVTLHLIYRIPQVYKYYLNNVNSKSDKFSIHLHNIIVTCNTNNDKNNKIDLNKIKGSLFNKDNSFKENEINDPLTLLNLIIRNANLDEILVFKNINIKDLCDCSSSILFNIEKFQNIFDIPLNDILKISENHSNSLFYNKNRLISFYKSMIEHNYSKKLSCPLNGEDCNYNRITRKFSINPDESNNSKIPYILFDYITDNNLNISMFNLLHSLILIPSFFELENLFDFEQGKDYIEDSEININIKYIFSGIIFKTKNKSFTCAFKKEDYWVYYDDNENYIILNNWIDVISTSLKNFLIPYIIYYQLQNENIIFKEEKISKEDLNYLENFAIKWDEYKYLPSNRLKLYEFVNQTVIQNTDNIKFQEDIENKEDKFSNHNNSIHQKNPFKREKKSYSTNQRILSDKNSKDNYIDFPLQINDKNNYNNNRTLNQVPKSSHHNRKENKTVINNNLKTFGINSGLSSVEIEISKSQNQNHLYEKEENEDRIKPYQISTDHKSIGLNNITNINKVTIPQIWVCSNCQRVNKAYEYKCQNCNIVNKNQKNTIEIYNRKSMTEDKNNYNDKNNQLLNSPYNINNYNKNYNNYNSNNNNNNNIVFSNINNTNLNSAFKKVSCICYSKMSDKAIENGICKFCGRKIPIYNNNYTMKNNINENRMRPGTAISIRTSAKYSAENTNNDIMQRRMLNNTNVNKHRQISTNRYNDDTYDELDDLIIKNQKNLKNFNNNNNNNNDKQNKRNELLNYKSNTVKNIKKKKY